MLLLGGVVISEQNCPSEINENINFAEIILQNNDTAHFITGC